MNTQELDILSEWHEADLSEVVIEFVRCHGRLPCLGDLLRQAFPQ